MAHPGEQRGILYLLFLPDTAKGRVMAIRRSCRQPANSGVNLSQTRISIFAEKETIFRLIQNLRSCENAVQKGNKRTGTINAQTFLRMVSVSSTSSGGQSHNIPDFSALSSTCVCTDIVQRVQLIVFPRSLILRCLIDRTFRSASDLHWKVSRYCVPFPLDELCDVANQMFNIAFSDSIVDRSADSCQNKSVSAGCNKGHQCLTSDGPDWTEYCQRFLGNIQYGLRTCAL